MAIDGARIQRITKEGLFYLDDEGKETFIDFEECYKRKLAEFMQPENLKRHQEINHMNDEQLEQSIQRRKETQYVAAKNSLGDPLGTAAYIEFYTDPPMRFEFEAKADKGGEIVWQIEFLAPLPPNSATKEELEAFFAGETGWRVYDLS
jgi:hypothetical protein